MSRNGIFVQCGIRAVKSWQMSGGVFLRIDTGVILIDDAIEANECLVLAEIKACQVRDCTVGK